MAARNNPSPPPISAIFLQITEAHCIPSPTTTSPNLRQLTAARDSPSHPTIRFANPRTIPYLTCPCYFAAYTVSCLYGTGPYRTVPWAMRACGPRAYTYSAVAQYLNYCSSGLPTLLCPVSSIFWPLNLAFFLVGYWVRMSTLAVDKIQFLSRQVFCFEGVALAEHNFRLMLIFSSPRCAPPPQVMLIFNSY